MLRQWWFAGWGKEYLVGGKIEGLRLVILFSHLIINIEEKTTAFYDRYWKDLNQQYHQVPNFKKSWHLPSSQAETLLNIASSPLQPQNSIFYINFKHTCKRTNYVSKKSLSNLLKQYLSPNLVRKINCQGFALQRWLPALERLHRGTWRHSL